MDTEFRKQLKIISGGQTGVDRAALDVALYLDIEHGGWCPRGRRSEAGPIPEIYDLRETESRDYTVRTEQNVIDSDGTLILFYDEVSGGTALTRRLCERHARPCLCVDLRTFDEEASEDESGLVQSVQNWIKKSNLTVLNVAGPRASSSAEIANSATAFLLQVFRSA